MNRPAQVLGRRSIYLLPTREGLWFGATLFVLLLAAVNYGNGLAYAITFLLAAFATVSAATGQRNLLGLTLHEGRPRAAFAGSPVGFRVVLTNPGDTPRLGVMLTAGQGPPITIDLAGREQRAIEIPWPTMRRGTVPAPVLRISSRYPFGLLRVFARRIVLHEAAIVYPRPAAFAALPPGAASDDRDDAGAVLQAGGGGDFTGLADYRPGENPRHIHWRAVAAGKGLLVKRFAGLAEREVWLVMDGAHGPEEGLRRLCRQVLDAERDGYRYGLALGALRIAPAAGAAHLERCLRSLALYDDAPR